MDGYRIAALIAGLIIVGLLLRYGRSAVKLGNVIVGGVTKETSLLTLQNPGVGYYGP